MTKTFWWIIGVGVVLIIILLIWRAQIMKQAPPPPGEEAPAALTTRMFGLQVVGTIAEDQVSSIETALKEISGVTDVMVDVTTNTIHITYDPAVRPDEEALKTECMEKLRTLNIETTAQAGLPPGGPQPFGD